MEILRKLSWYFKLRWKSYSLVVFLLVMCSILSAMIPRLVGNFVDLIANQSLTWSAVLTHSGLVLLLGIVLYVFRYIWRSQLFTNSTLLDSTLRKRLYRHFMNMDAEFFDRYRTGDLMAHATNDLDSLKFVAGGGVIALVDSISVSTVTILSMFFLVDWQLTLLTIIPFILLPFGVRFLSRLINRYFRGALEAFSSMNDHVQESVSGMQVVKSFGEEEEDYQDFVKETDQVVASNKQAYRVESAFVPMIQVVTALTYGLTIILGGYFVHMGRITLGDLVSYFSYLSMMVYPLVAVGRLINTLEKGNVSYDRISELLSEESRIKEVDQPLTSMQASDIECKLQSFTYPGDDCPSLEEVDFHLKKGQTLALVGPTGSGKTTLLELLVRNYDVSQGCISIDGENIKEYSLDTLNAHIGYVTQQSVLFSTSIRDNIRFGRMEMSQEEVEYFAKLADVHEDIMNFPDGYDTQVGERGVTLSGGQRQRISIARSLAMQPDIILFDDALSAVDAQTESTIIERISQHRQDEMLVIAAHRLSTVMHADEIIVLDHGQVIERGHHDQLIQNKGWYAQTYRQQQLERQMEEGGKGYDKK